MVVKPTAGAGDEAVHLSKDFALTTGCLYPFPYTLLNEPRQRKNYAQSFK